jgi:hypothetical protein
MWLRWMLQKSNDTAWSKKTQTDKCLKSFIPLQAMKITAQTPSSNITISLSVDRLCELFTVILTCLSAYKVSLNCSCMT